MKRWLLFLIIGLPVQLLVYMLYPLMILIFMVFIRNKTDKNLGAIRFTDKLKPHLDRNAILRAIPSLRDDYFLNNDDTHNSITHAQLWSLKDYSHLAREGLTELVRENGAVKRRAPQDQEYLPASGDCLSSWCYAYTLSGTKLPALVSKIAWHYLKNCLGIEHYNGEVSARSSNSGINYVFDGWKCINQPAFGPQYYTSAAIFSLAFKESQGWEKALWLGVYWTHWLLMGGWLWWIMPIIYSPTNYIYYGQHITAINMYTISKNMTNSPMLRAGMWILAKYLSPAGNCNPWIWILALKMGLKMDKAEIENTILSFNNTDAFMCQWKPINEQVYLNDGSDKQDLIQLRAILEMLASS